MPITPEEAWRVFRQADCLHTSAQIDVALNDMAREITAKLGDKSPLVLCVMTGALIPAAQLLLRLNFPLEIDYLHATRYGNATLGGQLQWIARPRLSLNGRIILLVDDILDEGRTLAAIIEDCRAAGASEIYTATLVTKDRSRDTLQNSDFNGLTVPDRYVFGYGMDYKGYLRNIAGIYAVNEHG
ncbi:MAG: hypoxanthine-guanine phosphoribosyltransferase [Gammaproteobacteria bacterium]|nr:hypoxanthine-guanine phosphoribosyltransferase [Gammaproteobacteria bacterium]